MKRGPRRQTPRPSKSNQSAKPIKDRRIVLIDDAPLRKRAATEFSRAMAKLEQARAEWQRFETEDRPAFERWLASTFGALLTELRENARLIDEQQALIDEVDAEMMWGNQRSPRKAYAAVMRRRENPEQEEDFDSAGVKADGSDSPNEVRPGDAHAEEDGDNSAPFQGMGEEIPEVVRREMFHDFVRAVFGLNPKQIPRAVYDSMFARFEADMFPGGRARSAPFAADGPEQPSSGPDESRIKEIYRILVRRLHPDTRADGNAQVSAIWHDVQEAYASRNLERLETLLALTEMRGSADGGQATVGKMRKAVEELKRSLRAIQRTIREGKRNPAWSFTQYRDRAPLEKSIRREMESNLAEQRQVLAHLKRTLDDWSSPAKPPARKTKKQRTQAANRASKRPESKAASAAHFQAEFYPF